MPLQIRRTPHVKKASFYNAYEAKKKEHVNVGLSYLVRRKSNEDEDEDEDEEPAKDDELVWFQRKDEKRRVVLHLCRGECEQYGTSYDVRIGLHQEEQG